MVTKGSSFADFVRFRPNTYACTQQSWPLFKPLWHSEESSGNKSTYIIEEEIANVETKTKRRVAPILVKTKSSKHVVEYQIDSGAS